MRRYGRSVLWDLGEVEYRVMKGEGRVNRKENGEDRTGREKIVGARCSRKIVYVGRQRGCVPMSESQLRTE